MTVGALHPAGSGIVFVRYHRIKLFGYCTHQVYLIRCQYYGVAQMSPILNPPSTAGFTLNPSSVSRAEKPTIVTPSVCSMMPMDCPPAYTCGISSSAQAAPPQARHKARAVSQIEKKRSTCCFDCLISIPPFVFDS